jgi:hypothetical protein
MPIEVRQLLIKSTVASAPEVSVARAAEPDPQWRERLREEVLSECKAWLEDRLQRMRER